MSGEALRLASLDDLPALLALERASFGEQGWTEAMFRAELQREGGAFYVISGEQGLLGFAVGWALAGTGEVLDIAVLPAARRRGLGRLLLEALEAHAAAGDAEQIWLEVRASNSAALALYRRAGYEQTGLRRRYYADGEDAVLMGRALSRCPERPAASASPPSG